MLSIARSGIMAQQAAIDTIGHNIANAGTPGYTRQVAVLSPAPALRTPVGVFGRGVDVTNVRGNRDALLTQAARTTGSTSGGAGVRSDLLDRVESIFGEPSDSGLASAMDAFWNAWSDLSNAPTDRAARVVVQQRGDALARQFNAKATQLAELEADTRAAASRDVQRINELAAQVASINGQIVPAEAGGHEASDLRDARDRLINEMATIASVTVLDRSDGTDAVLIGGMPVVDGSVAKTIAMSSTSPPGATFVGGAGTVRLGSGSLQARFEFLATDIPRAVAALDQLSSGMVTAVNAVHVTGWSPTAGAGGNWDPLMGATGSGVAFFDPAGVTARGMRLSQAVAADASAIATGDALDAPGNNRISLAIAALRTDAPGSPFGTFGSEFQSLVAQIAGGLSAARNDAEVASTLSAQAQARLDSRTGVSTDEELVDLIRRQQAYAASARIIDTARGLYDALMSIGR
ncbi:MAG: flagellar hook-associated protein FlgK [Gemmatimonadaceae bacterium]|nr:flagellar hook-associated protein FlgK [Gemmatimonadaceae bacterium]